MQTSSSRRETRTENRHAKKTGCMSGIFYFLHRQHHTHSRKRLPSGEKGKTASSPAAKPAPLLEKRPPAVDNGKRKPAKRVASPENTATTTRRVEQRRLSCDVPRSPTLPSEIRLSNSAESSETYCRSPALVARLMGLDDVPVRSPESAAEKRRKLLGALEKCDEDLKALKRIIEAVRLADILKKSTVRSVEPLVMYKIAGTVSSWDSDGGDSKIEEKRCLEADGEQPSPVSVLEEIPSPPSRRRSFASQKGNHGGVTATAVRTKIVKHAPSSGVGDRENKKEVKDTTESNPPFFHPTVAVEAAVEGWLPPRVSGRWRKGEGDFRAKREEGIGGRWRRSSSKAMVESVEEVWKDGVWEERWELGRVGVVLEWGILGDLVEEIVRELGRFYCYKFSLPFDDACRKRLCF